MQLLSKTLLGLALVAPAFTTATAGPKKKERAPVTLNVSNACAADLKLSLNDQSFEVAAGKESGDTPVVHADPAKGYTLKIDGATPADLGLLGLQDGQAYHLRLADCRNGGADVYLENTAEPPAGISPQAAAQVRFRAREIGNLEYKFGKDGRFKGLAVGMTSYQEVPAGPFDFTFRLRAAKTGPVMGMFDKAIEIKAGHNYLVESHVVGQAMFFKLEDEGFVGSEKK